jgi:hypothetical protein
MTSKNPSDPFLSFSNPLHFFSIFNSIALSGKFSMD